MTAEQLDQMLVAAFGPDYRDKVVCGWPLREAFDECGLRDPKAPREPDGMGGLWQISSAPLPRAAFDPLVNARAALARYLRPWKVWRGPDA